MEAMTAAVLERPDLTPHLGLIRGKAREVARHYAGYVTAEDLAQDIALWWYSVDPRQLRTYLQDDGLSRLRRAAFRVARESAENARRSSGVYNDDFVQARYRAHEILQIIPVALDPDGVPDGGGVQDEGPKAPKGNLAEGGEMLVSMIDVRQALAELNGDDHSYLRWMNRIRWNYDQAARELGIAADSVRRRVARICERMATYLNTGGN
jgi:DNA-directed RNA polymerase specialized sigma24 family protein